MTLWMLTALAASPEKHAARLVKKCEKPDPEACIELGWLTLAGEVVQKDYDEAIRLFGFGCNANVPEGCVGLARLSLEDPRFDLKTQMKVNKKACALMDATACDWLSARNAEERLVADAEREAFYAAEAEALAARTLAIDLEARSVADESAEDLVAALASSGMGNPTADEEHRARLTVSGAAGTAREAWAVLSPAADLGFSTLLVGEEALEVRLPWSGPAGERVFPDPHAEFASGEVLPVLVLDERGFQVLGVDHELRRPGEPDLSSIPCPQDCSRGYDIETLHEVLWTVKKRNHGSNGLLVVAGPDVAWANVLRTLDAVVAVPGTAIETSRTLFPNPYLLVGSVVGDPEPLHPDSSNPDKAPDGDLPRRTLRVAHGDPGACSLDGGVWVAATAVGAPFVTVALDDAPTCALELADTLVPGAIARNPSLTLFE